MNVPGRFAATQIPQWLLNVLHLTRPRNDNQEIIACVELVGVISLLLTYPDIFAHCRAFLCQDNSCAFAAMVSRRSRSENLNSVANVYHLVAEALGIDSWAERCTNKAMLADKPSSFELHHEHHADFIKMGLVERTAVFPTAEEWSDPITFYLSLCRTFGSRLTT